MESFSASTNSFSVDLYKKLDETSKGQNIFFAPWSIATALAMVHLGAKGDTAMQIAKVLHFNQTAREESPSEMTAPSMGRPKKRDMGPEYDETENIHSGFKELLSAINKPRNTYLLKSANQLFEDKTYPLLPKFLELITRYYQVKPQAVNFKTDVEQARAQINSWVENETERKIQNLLPAGSLDSHTVLVLVNAIYFKGNWEKRFLKKDTSEMPFRLSKTKTKPVQMMFLTDTFLMFHEQTMKFKIIELPYVENEVSMFILLPDDISDNTTGLELVERELTHKKLAEWSNSASMMKVEVELYLPKLKMEENYDLTSTLSNMGIQNAFDPVQADFTRMSAKKDLFISKVIHKAFAEPLNMDSLSTANSTFALDLLRQLREKSNTKNLFFSPFSISSALSMILLGSKGNTESQIAKVLSLNKAEDAHNGYQSLLSEINNPDTKYILRTANRLYGEKTFKFLSSFVESSQKFYHAGLEQADFKNASEDSRRQINGWVEEKTEGKIQKLLAEGIINSMTRLVLVNAIYFKGNWEQKFDKECTNEVPFKINKNETKPVQMMFRKGKYNMTYIGDLETQVLEIPYVGNELSMIILLPDAIKDESTGLEKLERELTYEKLMDWINPEMMDSTEVRLSLPRFKLEESYDLKPILSNMGMRDAFDLQTANFSGISSGNELVLSEVVHKSFVEVNEEGTEAAAATAGVMMLRCAMIVPNFTADHPFLFFIRHNKTSSILFCGRFCSP